MSGAAVVYLSDLSQPVEVGVHGEVIGLAEARHNDLIMKVTMFIHRHPGMARSTGSNWWGHEVACQKRGQL